MKTTDFWRTVPAFSDSKMKEALDLRSKSGIHRLVTALEERGCIRRLPHRARALEVVKLPDSIAPGLAPRKATGFNPSVIEGSLGRRRDTEEVETGTGGSSTSLATVPLMGKIAAGVPISAIQDHSHNIDVPPEMLGAGEHYALEVKGDSMIEAGILEGDTVLIKKVPSADNGDIVVALVDDEEATLKRIRRKGHSIALEAANPAYETRIFGPDRVDVQGKLVGLIRRY